MYMRKPAGMMIRIVLKPKICCGKLTSQLVKLFIGLYMTVLNFPFLITSQYADIKLIFVC